MNKISAVLCLLFFVSVLFTIETLHAQILSPNASKEDIQGRVKDRNSQEEQLNRRNDQIQRSIQIPRAVDEPSRRITIDSSLYRKSTKEELATVMPEQADLNKFAEFLRQPKTGLIKLMGGRGCNEKMVISATADCLKFTVPGSGASYSFRVSDYRIAELADLNFEDDNFKCLGKRVQGIMTSIGDIALEKVDLQTPGLKFLTTFNAESDSRKMQEKKAQFSNGVLQDGFTYRNEGKAIENVTYVLRSIAYKNQNHSLPELDNRKDVIIAFRVVRKSADDNSVTILWKELARKGSPTMKGEDR